MKKEQPKFKLIKYGSIKGYAISNIKAVLTTEQYDDFEKWIYGQTVGIYKGEDLIYAYDLNRFLENNVTPEFKRSVKEFINEHNSVLRKLSER